MGERGAEGNCNLVSCTLLGLGEFGNFCKFCVLGGRQRRNDNFCNFCKLLDFDEIGNFCNFDNLGVSGGAEGRGEMRTSVTSINF